MWMRRALRLVGATFCYNAIEAVVAIASGIAAGSIALVGFGLDSVLECSAAILLFWRLRREGRGADRESIESAERTVHRFVGATFLALALYVAAQAAWTLWKRDVPEESPLGIGLAVVSLVVMPVVAVGKLRAAKVLGSGALRAEAKETLACSYLSFTLLAGLLARAVAGWWWADAIAALLMVPWLVREGVEGIRGEGCGCDGESSR
jgi:divalent metal cation (Fe/Co/Zn/Cd) transporter